MIIYINKDKFKFSSELMILIGLLNDYPSEPIHCINHKNKSRYYPLLDFCKRIFNIQKI